MLGLARPQPVYVDAAFHKASFRRRAGLGVGVLEPLDLENPVFLISDSPTKSGLPALVARAWISRPTFDHNVVPFKGRGLVHHFKSSLTQLSAAAIKRRCPDGRKIALKLRSG